MVWLQRILLYKRQKMNKAELIGVNEILEIRLKELNQQNQLKKECKSNNK